MNIQTDILDFLGSDATEEMVHQEFDGKTETEVLAILNEMFPSDDNQTLAHDIYEYIS